MPHVLIVDDDSANRGSLARFVVRQGHTVTQAASAAEATALLERERIDLVISDMEMPGGTGFVVLEAGMRAKVPVVILTAHGSVEMAVDAMKRGAANFLTKPFSQDSVAQVLNEVFDPRVQSASRRAKTPVEGIIMTTLRETGSGRLVAAGGEATPTVSRERGSGPGAPIGEDQAFLGILSIVERVADTDATILLSGESGTGKEVVAHAIHNASKRRDRPFVAVNCGAIPEGLLESELFGHTKGAFTGATQARRGRFAMAEGGTLFLDEIADMPLVLQVKILRVIQERRYEMLGDSKEQVANVRFIAATNRKLQDLVAEGRFREDLYYRLNVVPLHLPPLRERVRDIPLLVHHFIAEANAAHWRSVTGISAEAMNLLANYQWPGNVRELCNMVERMVVMRGSGPITAVDVPGSVRTGPGRDSLVSMELPSSGIDLSEALQRFEGVLIEKALERTRGNRTQAAALLRINRTTLVQKLKKLDGNGDGNADEDR